MPGRNRGSAGAARRGTTPGRRDPRPPGPEKHVPLKCPNPECRYTLTWYDEGGKVQLSKECDIVENWLSHHWPAETRHSYRELQMKDPMKDLDPASVAALIEARYKQGPVVLACLHCDGGETVDLPAGFDPLRYQWRKALGRPGTGPGGVNPFQRAVANAIEHSASGTRRRGSDPGKS
jgi:hypothetical protein